MSALDKIARHVGFFEGKKVVRGELRVAGLLDDVVHQAQELRDKLGNQTQELRDKNQDEKSEILNLEIVRREDKRDLLNEGAALLVVNDGNESGGKILTFSPLPDERVAGSACFATRETFAVAVGDVGC